MARVQKIEDGSTSTQAPKFKSFFLLINPLMGINTAIPKYFYKSFKEELPTTVWLIDPATTKIGVFLRKYDQNGYFQLGLTNVLRHYKLPHGAWIYLKYEGAGTFKLRVLDLNFAEVNYPKTPKIIDFGDYVGFQVTDNKGDTEIGSQSRDAPKYRRFLVCVDPNDVEASVPWPFYESFKEEVSTRVWFVDPVGSEIGIIIQKFDSGANFVHGILNILKHYSLTYGAWVELTYQGNDKFDMRVMDLNFNQISYPQAVIKYDFLIKHLNQDFRTKHSRPLFIHNEVDPIRTFQISLTKNQITTNNMNLPARFSFEFIHGNIQQSLEIEDEEGRKFTCQIRRGRRPGEAHLKSEWKKFCVANKLMERNRIEIHVISPDPLRLKAKILSL